VANTYQEEVAGNREVCNHSFVTQLMGHFVCR
jgi:hypothetical protein